MLAEIGKATAGETMAKPLQKCKSITGKSYQMHSTESSENFGKKIRKAKSWGRSCWNRDPRAQNE